MERIVANPTGGKIATPLHAQEIVAAFAANNAAFGFDIAQHVAKRRPDQCLKADQTVAPFTTSSAAAVHRIQGHCDTGRGIAIADNVKTIAAVQTVRAQA
ncbi:MAG: hypothetical protein AAGH68_01770, partial [Pseudomonadota bacterium]